MSKEFNFQLVGIVIVILGAVIDTLAIVLAIFVSKGFLALLIPGTCYIVNSSIVLILNRNTNRTSYKIFLKEEEIEINTI